MTRIEQKIAKLNKMFPDIRGMKIHKDKHIHLGNIAEGGKIDDMPAADYYGEFNGGYAYVNPKLTKALETMGYQIEWENPGELIAWKQ